MCLSLKRNFVAIRQTTVCKLALLLVGGVIAAGGTLGRAQASVDLLVQQVEARYNSAKTLSVDFTQSYSILGHRRPVETGTLTLRKIGKMRWDYQQPPGKLFVSDGKTVFLYTARDNRVEKVPLKNTEDMRAPLAFLLGKLNMKKEFRAISVRPAENGSWLDAQSKTDRLPYQSIQMLVVGSGQIQQLQVQGRDESITHYQFANERVNPPVADSLFHFRVPVVAEVVDALETRSLGGR